MENSEIQNSISQKNQAQWQISKIENSDIQNSTLLKNLTHWQVSVICMLIQCLQEITQEDKKWFTCEEFYAELNLHPFSWNDSENATYHKFSIEELNKLMEMIAFIGTFETKEENGKIYYRKENIVYGFKLPLNRNHNR